MKVKDATHLKVGRTVSYKNKDNQIVYSVIHDIDYVKNNYLGSQDYYVKVDGNLWIMSDDLIEVYKEGTVLEDKKKVTLNNTERMQALVDSLNKEIEAATEIVNDLIIARDKLQSFLG